MAYVSLYVRYFDVVAVFAIMICYAMIVNLLMLSRIITTALLAALKHTVHTVLCMM